MKKPGPCPLVTIEAPEQLSNLFLNTLQPIINPRGFSAHRFPRGGGFVGLTPQILHSSTNEKFLSHLFQIFVINEIIFHLMRINNRKMLFFIS